MGATETSYKFKEEEREKERERDAFVTYIAAGAGNERIKDVRLFFLVLFLTAL